jgi:hypothetical protein
MPEKPKSVPVETDRTSRGVARDVLSLAKQHEVLEGLSPDIKAEVYGIMAYFIEKATARFMEWHRQYPNDVLIANTRVDDDLKKVETNVVSQPDTIVTEQPKLSVTALQLYRVLHGSMHYHLKALANTYVPGPVVNEEDMAILDRLDTLLIDQQYRDGVRRHSEDFLLAVAQPQARFIASTLFGALQAYENQFGELPLPSSSVFSEVMQEALKAIMRMAAMNLQDFAVYERAMSFFGDDINCFIQTPYARVEYIRDESEKLRMNDFTREYKPSAAATAAEPTIGCPALFGRPTDAGNSIAVFTNYAIALLERSHYQETANYIDNSLYDSVI